MKHYTVAALALLVFACSKAPLNPPAPSSPLAITLREPRLEACIGMTRSFISFISWTDSSNPAPEGPPILVWRSLHPRIAAITADGEITPLSPGRALIEVQAELAGQRATTQGELIVLPGKLDAEATQQSGHLTCGR